MSTTGAQGNKLETWGNESTMNLNAIIYQNILASPYFKSLYEKKTFHEIVDEIYNEVYNLSPFLKGTNPSTAYCCLYKLWTLRLTIKQIENLVDHPDSPYIRAVGFLYLRYVCVPAQLWDWFQYYLEDEEEIDLTGGPKPQKSTIGKLIRMLILEQKFQGTMLPRIPVPIARDLVQKLEDHDREIRENASDSKGDSYGSDDRRDRDRDRSRERERERDRDRDRDRHRDRDRDRDHRSRSSGRHHRTRSTSPDRDSRRESGVRRKRNEFGEYEPYKSSTSSSASTSHRHDNESRHSSRRRSRSPRRSSPAAATAGGSGRSSRYRSPERYSDRRRRSYSKDRY